MSEGPTTTPFSGLVLVICPLLCLALPPLVVAGIGAVLILEVGIALAGLGLASLAAAGVIVLRRRRTREPCCTHVDHVDTPNSRERTVATDRSLAEATKR